MLLNPMAAKLFQSQIKFFFLTLTDPLTVIWFGRELPPPPILTFINFWLWMNEYLYVLREFALSSHDICHLKVNKILTTITLRVSSMQHKKKSAPSLTKPTLFKWNQMQCHLITAKKIEANIMDVVFSFELFSWFISGHELVKEGCRSSIQLINWIELRHPSFTNSFFYER
jgi:hypothetical protein